MNSLRRISLIVALTACCGFAGTLSYEMTGTFSGAVPSTTYSAPNSLFKLTFELSEQPVLDSVSEHSFGVRADLRYTLDTQPTVDILNALIAIYDSTQLGMFDMELSSNLSFSIFGPMIFSGSPDKPTMLGGTFAADSGSQFFADGNPTELSNVVVQSQIPEPVTGLLVGAVLLGFGVLRRRVR